MSEVVQSAIGSTAREGIRAVASPRPDPRYRPSTSTTSAGSSPAVVATTSVSVSQHDRFEGGFIRCVPPPEARGRRSLDCRESTPHATLRALPYVVRSRSNTVGELRTSSGREEGLRSLIEPGLTIEDRSPRATEVFRPGPRNDVAQDVHRLRVEERSLPRSGS